MVQRDSGFKLFGAYQPLSAGFDDLPFQFRHVEPVIADLVELNRIVGDEQKGGYSRRVAKSPPEVGEGVAQVAEGVSVDLSGQSRPANASRRCGLPASTAR